MNCPLFLHLLLFILRYLELWTRPVQGIYHMVNSTDRLNVSASDASALNCIAQIGSHRALCTADSENVGLSGRLFQVRS
ncbi:hypothetical protein BDQ17DRAFT_387739 [Cyathus striatus]|nr:hypothetical protein BDQ17DRAFT_387739 [Cyathus striatus]